MSKHTPESRARIAERQRAAWASGVRDHQKTGITVHDKACQCGKEFRTINPKTKWCSPACHSRIRKPSKGLKMSAGWEKADEVCALYAQGLKHKPIALQLGITPRIVRVILIDRGAWNPCPKRQTKKGVGKYARSEESPQMRTQALFRAMTRVVKRIKSETPKRRSALMGAAKRAGMMITRDLSKTDRWMWKYNNDPQTRIIHLYRKRMRKVLFRGDQGEASLEMLGCSRAHWKAHMEKQFKPGMTWKNNGIGRGKWNIDHIIPCASFDMTNPSHQRRCFHYTNMRPMWAIANIKKSDKTPNQHQWTLL